MSVPLDKQQIIVENGKVKESVPALDPRWMSTIQFVCYQAPPIDLSDNGQYVEWLERLTFIEQDLHWLLQQTHSKFWCQVIFDETLHRCIDSYLRYAPRSYSVIRDLPEAAKECSDNVHRLVFIACLRMATHKESKTCHITPNVFGQILYENFLFDVPKMLDLCVLYGSGNDQLLTKMINNIFTQQPKYNEDLVLTIHTISQVFNSVIEKCGIKQDHGTPQKLSDLTGNLPPLVTMAVTEFTDVILYLFDIGLTLTSFLKIYPAACKAFYDNEFLTRLPVFYDAVVPEVFSALKQRDLETSEKLSLKQMMLQAKRSLLTLFKIIISHSCIQPILEKSEMASNYVEDYFKILTAILGERRFLADYESLYSFQGDFEILSQASCEMDETRLHYVLEVINMAFSTHGKRKSPKGAMNRGGRQSPDGSPGPVDDGGAVGGSSTTSSAAAVIPADVYQTEDYDALGACASQITGVELDSLISSVKDLLPELGEGFIELCLEEFNYDQEKVINIILENKLPPSLQGMDKLMKRKKRATPVTSLISERKNIYDYDEFDVFHRDDIDKQKVRKGKSAKSDEVSIGDKSALEGFKDKITKDYGIVYDVVEDDRPARPYTNEGNVDVYDDEYDDTYDTNVVGADDADSADELTSIRPFTVPRVLGGPPKLDRQQDVQESEESEEDGDERSDSFVVNPAVIRQRAEETARSKADREKQKEHKAKVYDVKGGPKGQGQSSEVLKNRRWKTQHKGGNRRALADKKRRI